MFKIGDFSRLSQVSIKALRYYDEIGLLKPASVDRFTGYRYYSAGQLPRLNRILALKDLGLSLDQIADLLTADVPTGQMQALLRQKRAEIAQGLAEEQARLARVEARLRQIEQEGALSEYEVVIKAVPAQRVAAVRDVVPTYADAGPLFAALVGYFRQQDIDPAAPYPYMSLYHDDGYREQEVDMTVAAPVDRSLPDGERVRVYELPPVETMASVIHRGPYDRMDSAYLALMAFLEANRCTISGPNRNLYLHGAAQSDDPGAFVTEVQFPVEKA
jgi:DNA-binding transcriptional MerR regulator